MNHTYTTPVCIRAKCQKNETLKLQSYKQKQDDHTKLQLQQRCNSMMSQDYVQKVQETCPIDVKNEDCMLKALHLTEVHKMCMNQK